MKKEYFDVNGMHIKAGTLLFYSISKTDNRDHAIMQAYHYKVKDDDFQLKVRILIKNVKGKYENYSQDEQFDLFLNNYVSIGFLGTSYSNCDNFKIIYTEPNQISTTYANRYFPLKPQKVPGVDIIVKRLKINLETITQETELLCSELSIIEDLPIDEKNITFLVDSRMGNILKNERLKKSIGMELTILEKFK